MAELREVLTNAGFSNARTYIASGNALVDTDLTSKEVEKRVHDLIKEHIGPALAVFARTGDQLQAVLDENPFKEGYDISRTFFTLFQEPPSRDKVAKLLTQDFLPEELRFSDHAAYLFIPGSAARSQLSSISLGKLLGVSATSRNFNTLTKLVEMSRDLKIETSSIKALGETK